MGLRALVIGSDRLGLRIGEQLERDGCAVTLVAVPGSFLAEAELPATWHVLRARPDAPGVLAAAGLAQADAVLAVSDADELNLGAALRAREARPGVRLVVRQFNVRLGRLLQRHLPEARILSLSHSTAPTFAFAALVPDVIFAHDAGGEALLLRDCASPPQASERVLGASGDEGVTWGQAAAVARGARRWLVATRASEGPRRPWLGPERGAEPRSQRAHADSDRLLALTLGALLALLAGVAWIFRARLGLAPLDAIYFVSTILTTVGFGDFNLRDAADADKLLGIVTMYAGLFLSALLVGLVTNRLLARQQERRRGHFRTRLAGHVVVCGLGSLGLRIAEALRDEGQPVVAVDPDPRERFAFEARGAGIPLVYGDAALERVLHYANVRAARALVVATSHDHLNVEIALVARSLAPRLPVILRFFDPELCAPVATTFGLEATFSGALLGAGLFAAFAAGDTRLARLQFAGRACELHRLPARAGCSVRALVAERGALPVAVIDGQGRVRLPSDDGETLDADAALLALIPDPPLEQTTPDAQAG